MKKKIKTALVILAAAFFMAGCGGVCELLIGICDLKEPDDHKVDYDEIYDMYTVIDGEFKHVFSAFSERYRYYLCENGAIAHENSTSAAD